MPGVVAGDSTRASGFSIAVCDTVCCERSSTARSRVREASASRSSAATWISAPWLWFSRPCWLRSAASRLATRAWAARVSASSAWTTRPVSPPTARSVSASRDRAARTSGWFGPRVACSRSTSRRASSRAARAPVRLEEASAVRSAPPPPRRAAFSRASAVASWLRASIRSLLIRLTCSVASPALTPRVRPEAVRSSAMRLSVVCSSARSWPTRPSSQSLARRTALNFASS